MGVFTLCTLHSRALLLCFKLWLFCPFLLGASDYNFFLFLLYLGQSIHRHGL